MKVTPFDSLFLKILLTKGNIQYAISVLNIPKPAPANTSPTQCLSFNIENPDKRFQDGPKEYLLCNDAEQMFRKRDDGSQITSSFRN